MFPPWINLSLYCGSLLNSFLGKAKNPHLATIPGAQMWPRIYPSSHTPLSFLQHYKAGIWWGLSSWLTEAHLLTMSLHDLFSVCIEHSGVFLKEHSCYLTRAPPLWCHLTLITSLKVYLQTWSHGGLELQSMKLRQRVATIQSITDINYVSVSVPLTVASVLSGLNILHRVEKIFLNA